MDFNIFKTLLSFMTFVTTILTSFAPIKKFRKRVNKTLSFATIFLMNSLLVDDLKVSYTQKVLEVKRPLMISNHVGYYDGIFIWLAISQLKPGVFIIMFAKYQIFFLAWMFEILNRGFTKFFLLFRDFNYDVLVLRKASLYYNQLEHEDACMLIFPEGTLYQHVHSKFLGEERSVHRNIQNLNNVIIPKNKGVDTLIRYSKFDSVIDCTIKIVNKPNGRIDVHLLFIVIDLPKVEENINGKWILERFEEKNKRLGQKSICSNIEEQVLTIDLHTNANPLYMMINGWFDKYLGVHNVLG